MADNTPTDHSVAVFEGFEKRRRIYYQNIVYEVCNILDRHRRDGRKTTCGTVEYPSDEVQKTLAGLWEKSHRIAVSQQAESRDANPEVSTKPTMWTVRDRILDVTADLTKIMASSYASDIGPMLKAATLLTEARKALAE